jgi:hypothetical protein
VKFGVGRQVYHHCLSDTGAMDRILRRGAEKVRTIGKPLLSKIRRKIGIE